MEHGLVGLLSVWCGETGNSLQFEYTNLILRPTGQFLGFFGTMSVQGELYRSYDSFVDGRMYQSMGSEGSVTLHQAAQFIQVWETSTSKTNIERIPFA